MKLTTVNAIYSRLAKTYDRELRDDMQYTSYLKVPQLVIDVLGHKQANILDLGCGTGLSSLLFFEKGYDVTGIDGTSAMIRRARKLPYKKVIQLLSSRGLASRRSGAGTTHPPDAIVAEMRRVVAERGAR